LYEYQFNGASVCECIGFARESAAAGAVAGNVRDEPDPLGPLLMGNGRNEKAFSTAFNRNAMCEIPLNRGAGPLNQADM